MSGSLSAWLRRIVRGAGDREIGDTHIGFRSDPRDDTRCDHHMTAGTY